MKVAVGWEDVREEEMRVNWQKLREEAKMVKSRINKGKRGYRKKRLWQ